MSDREEYVTLYVQVYKCSISTTLEFSTSRDTSLRNIPAKAAQPLLPYPHLYEGSCRCILARKKTGRCGVTKRVFPASGLAARARALRLVISQLRNHLVSGDGEKCTHAYLRLLCHCPPGPWADGQGASQLDCFHLCFHLCQHEPPHPRCSHRLSQHSWWYSSHHYLSRRPGERLSPSHWSGGPFTPRFRTAHRLTGKISRMGCGRNLDTEKRSLQQSRQSAAAKSWLNVLSGHSNSSTSSGIPATWYQSTLEHHRKSSTLFPTLAAREYQSWSALEGAFCALLAQVYPIYIVECPPYAIYLRQGGPVLPGTSRMSRGWRSSTGPPRLRGELTQHTVATHESSIAGMFCHVTDLSHFSQRNVGSRTQLLLVFKWSTVRSIQELHVRSIGPAYTVQVWVWCGRRRSRQ